MTVKVQACTTPKNVKTVQAFLWIWRFWRTFIPYLVQSNHPLYHLIKKGYMWDCGIRAEGTNSSEGKKILMKHIKSLGISQIGLAFELHVSVILEGMDWASGRGKKEEKRVLLGFGPSSGRGQKPDIP